MSGSDGVDGAGSTRRPGRVGGPALLTGLALTGFAANSILCRSALGRLAIDATSFTTVRILAGALTLVALARLAPRRALGAAAAAWPGALALYAYALAFSLAYRRLGTGTGAFILFAAVQATMIGAGIARGDRPSARQWTGIAIALAGLGWLTRPGLAAPDPPGAALMALAGIAWGAYSLRGRAALDPLRATAASFLGAVPLALTASAVSFGQAHATKGGILLAAVSGSITSGIGYSLWYAALADLAPAKAAVVQLAVPVLAAAGGIVFLGEELTARLIAAAGFILGGIALVVTGRSSRRPPPLSSPR